MPEPSLRLFIYCIIVFSLAWGWERKQYLRFWNQQTGKPLTIPWIFLYLCIANQGPRHLFGLHMTNVRVWCFVGFFKKNPCKEQHLKWECMNGMSACSPRSTEIAPTLWSFKKKKRNFKLWLMDVKDSAQSFTFAAQPKLYGCWLWIPPPQAFNWSSLPGCFLKAIASMQMAEDASIYPRRTDKFVK